jgi:type IV pilus assembly protein PilM
MDSDGVVMRSRHFGRTGVFNADGHAIGVDIGATAVRAAVLTPGVADGRPVATLHGCGSVALPPGVVVDGVVRDQGAVTEALKQLWRANKLEGKRVVVGIANPQILVRDMQMPDMPADQRAKALPFRAREVVALPLDQVILDFAPLGPPDAETHQQNGLLVATPHQPVLAAVEAAERAGLTVVRVDLSSLGTLRAAADERLRVEAIIDIGSDLTTIVIHDHGIPKLVRSVAQGGRHLTEALSVKMRLDFAEAEAAKIEMGLVGDDAVTSRALNESIRPLITEIRSSINYYTGNDGSPLERMSLTGGAAWLLGLPGLLSAQLGVPTDVVDPMRRVRLAGTPRPNRALPSRPTAVAVGLAMGAAA